MANSGAKDLLARVVTEQKALRVCLPPTSLDAHTPFYHPRKARHCLQMALRRAPRHSAGLKGSEVSGERGAQIGPQVGGQDSEFQPCPHYLKQDA